jgi:hypothetical protein
VSKIKNNSKNRIKFYKEINNENTISPESENGIVISPFPYKYTQDNESIISVFECNEDPPIIKNITSSIKLKDFVPYDNNIEMMVL